MVTDNSVSLSVYVIKLEFLYRTRDATFNEEEGCVRFFLRGRPVIVHAPTAVAENYDIMKVATAPQARLKLEWVYPLQVQLYHTF
jgi:hypothetical protein